VMTTPENLKTALDAGAVDYIRKPVEKLELTARVNSMLKLSDFIKRVKEQNETLFEQKNEIENQNVKLTEHVATKDKFFSIIAHDLINHFNGIIGMSELLVNYGDDIEDFPKMIEAINHEAVDAFKLLENLLQWARSQTNRISFNPIQLNLNNLVEKIFKLLDNMAASKKITLTSTIADNFTVLGDNDMLHTILRNLVSNAIKFTNKNGMVSIRAEKQQHQNIISISDSGVGMSEKILKKLFKINEKISSKGTENEAGTGLGLLLCKEFVEKHHGKILVESQIGNGSTFSIYLPVNE